LSADWMFAMLRSIDLKEMSGRCGGGSGGFGGISGVSVGWVGVCLEMWDKARIDPGYMGVFRSNP